MYLSSLTGDTQALSSITGHTSELAIPESVSTAQISSNVENYFIFFERYLNNLEYLEILHPKKRKRQGIKQKAWGNIGHPLSLQERREKRGKRNGGRGKTKN